MAQFGCLNLVEKEFPFCFDDDQWLTIIVDDIPTLREIRKMIEANPDKFDTLYGVTSSGHNIVFLRCNIKVDNRLLQTRPAAYILGKNNVKDVDVN